MRPEIRIAEDFLLWERELTVLPEPSPLPLWANRWELLALIVTWLLGAVVFGITIWVLIA